MGDALDPTPPRGARRRVQVFALIAAAMLAISALVVTRAVLRRAAASEPPTPGGEGGAAAPDLATLARAPHLLFRSLERAQAEDFGRLGLAALEPAPGGRALGALRCVRVHFAAGQGLCMEMEDEGGRKTLVHTFGPDLRPRWKLPLGGLPSRARVSPDGHYGAVTIFVTGHAYSDADMSTQTVILDLREDRLVADLEKLEVTRDGVRFEASDFNFWGVTFARDANRFYATLSSGGKTWLVEGDVAAGKMRTLRENVECPSLSPDGKRLGFKKRIAGPGAWRLHVLDLATLQDRPLAEERPIDDQVEWLDDGHLLYKHGPDLWTLDVNGTAPATVYLARASSPAVVR